MTDLSKHVSGQVEISSFDDRPVFNTLQRWQLFEQSLITSYQCSLEEERYALHQAVKPYVVGPLRFETEVEGVPF